jgi:hypothetical protein
LGGELMKSLAQKSRAGEAPVHPLTLVAAHSDGGGSGESLHLGGVLKALAIGSSSGQQAGRQSLSRSREVLKNLAFGMAGTI